MGYHALKDAFTILNVVFLLKAVIGSCWLAETFSSIT